MRIWYLRGRLSTRPGSDRTQYFWQAVRDVFPEDQFELLYLDDLEKLPAGVKPPDLVFVHGVKPLGHAKRLGLDLAYGPSFRVYIADWERNRAHIDRECRGIGALRSDAVIITQTMYMRQYRQHSGNVHFVDRGFDPSVFYPCPLGERTQGVVFCGNWFAFDRLRRLKMMGLRFPGKVSWKRHPAHVHMARFLRSGRIGWNQIQKMPIAKGINYRVWEVLGSGLLLLTNKTADVARVLKEGKEVVFWQDDKDLLEKAAYYLQHPAEAHEIAMAGHAAALEKHTWSHRGQQIRKIVDDLLNSG